jgi:pimeloyl-ACP methyl ester carboxylesterase
MSHAPWWQSSLTVAPTLVYDLQTVHDVSTDPDWAARWAGVTRPTIVYSGDQTFPGLPEAADAVAAAIPQATRRVLPGQGHGPAPEAIAPVLVEFLQTVPTAAV